MAGAFLLVKPIIRSSYKRTIIQCKSTSLRWCAVLSKLCLKVKKIPALPPCVEDVCLSINLATPPLGLAVKSSGSNFSQALGSVLPLSFVHLPIVLSNLVLPYSVPGR